MNSIKITQAPKHIESFGSITGYYIGYKVLGSDKPYTFKTIENHAHSKLEAIVSNLKKSTMYTFSVQAFNTKGAGPASSEVTGKTLDKDPPSPPRLRVITTTATSVTLGWSSTSSLSSSPDDTTTSVTGMDYSTFSIVLFLDRDHVSLYLPSILNVTFSHSFFNETWSVVWRRWRCMKES